MDTENVRPRLIRVPQLRAMLGDISNTSLHRMRQDPNFPKPVTGLGRIVAWDVDEINAWLEYRKSLR